jgi:exonuclease III
MEGLGKTTTELDIVMFWPRFKPRISRTKFRSLNLKYSIIDLDKYFKDQDIEVCVLKLKSTFFSVCIIAVYRAPTGNFNLFLNRLDDIIRTLYKANLQLIICGDINIVYLTDNDKKRQLDAVLLTYSL